MQEHQSRYQRAMDNAADFIQQAAENDVLSLMDIIETAKAYWHAGESLSKDELLMLENWLLRDIETFRQQWQAAAGSSFWWQSVKGLFWQQLARLSDQNRLEMEELSLDIAHQGEYQAGELVSLGTLTCTRCGHQVSVDFVTTIEPCLQCGNERFFRSNSR
ncbi:zinc ribbon-containing protein [Aestuariibacter halophilus]|uniref:Zinc ribbon-containing protein n=1 Tax=Fluctibacter halophilus TaxID=226011 RepID=A0ABS8G5F0_9ALTE|nr:zinc ribbon-containing protein [Aestuariibacter halophilus]MCC2615807.1 zinc ribbon-containing protein [Aestuariibacter halophilus]